MRNVLAIAVGLVLGICAAIALGAALIAVTPAPGARVTPPPTTAAPSRTPAASPTVGEAGTPAALGSGAAPTAAAGGTVSPFPLVGRPAPALTAPQVGGGRIDLAALRGKPVWVVFTGTYCPPCRDEYPLMNGYAARYAATGLVVIAIHVREGEQTVAPFVSSLNVVFPVGLDADGSRARTWDAAALPVHYFIDAQGIVRDAALGGLGAGSMASGLRAILPGVTVSP